MILRKKGEEQVSFKPLRGDTVTMSSRYEAALGLGTGIRENSTRFNQRILSME